MTMAISREYNEFEQEAVIKVCGVGGGGGNAVGRMIEAELQGVEFITINTDAQALRHSPAGTRIQVGEGGLGAGARPEVAEEAARQDRDQIAEALAGADMIFLTAGLGGGTGTGAAPVVAEVARETGALTVSIVTLPFGFENKQRMDNAMKGLAALQEHSDSLIVIPNDRLALLCQENTSFLGAFRLADEVLHNGVRAISELITVPGLINLDFADVRTTMVQSGRALMGIGMADGDNRAVRAAEEAIVCPLLEHSSIDGALGVIVNVKGGSDITMREVLQAVTTVKRSAHATANIIFGAVLDEEERPDIQVTVIAAGFAQESSQRATPAADDIADVFERRVKAAEQRGTKPTGPKAASSAPKPAPRPKPAAPAPLTQAAPVAQDKAPATPVATAPASDEASSNEGAQAPGEQYLFPDEPEGVDTKADVQDEEDMGIPAFMRKRMTER
ncbi:MAG: cell division protein FtsZ [bacterium]|nr:cell division protein FtsZ [bacterium]